MHGTDSLPSFETRPSKSAVADFDTLGCRSRQARLRWALLRMRSFISSHARNAGHDTRTEPPELRLRLQRRRQQFRFAAVGFGRFEIELDLDAVGIEQEQLIEALVVDAAFLEIDALSLEMLDQIQEAGGAKRHVVDDARADGGCRLLAEILHAVFRDFGAAMGDVQHVV